MNKVQLLSLKNQKAFDICSKKAIRYSSRLFFILVSIIPKNTKSNIAANSDKSSKYIATRKKIKPTSSHIYYGFKISKKFGKAHERNLLRRRIKNIYQELLKPKELDLSIIFVPRKGKIELPIPNQPKRNETNVKTTNHHQLVSVDDNNENVMLNSFQHPPQHSGDSHLRGNDYSVKSKNHPDHLKIQDIQTPSHRLNQTGGFKDETRGAYLNVGEHGEIRKNHPDHLKIQDIQTPSHRLNQMGGFKGETRGAYLDVGEHGEIQKNHPDHLKIQDIQTPSHRLNQTSGFKDETRGAYLNVGEHGEIQKNHPDHLKMWLGVKEIPYEILRSEIEKALNWCLKNLKNDSLGSLD